MNRLRFPVRTVLALSGAIALAACGSSDDASDAAIEDTVEIPADEALADVADEPVVDETIVSAPQRAPAAAEEDTGPSETEQAQAEAAGERAAAAAADVAAIAAAAEAANSDADTATDVTE